MALVRRSVASSLAYGHPHLYDKSAPGSILIDVTTASMTGTLAELGLLAHYAAELFKELFDMSEESYGRVAKLQERCAQLATDVPKAAAKALAVDGDKGGGRFEATPPDEPQRVAFNASTMPASLKARYDSDLVNPNPDFASVDALLADELKGATGTCATKYSYPGLFLDKWAADEMERIAKLKKKKAEKKADRKEKKRLLKGSDEKRTSAQIKKETGLDWRKRYLGGVDDLSAGPGQQRAVATQGGGSTPLGGSPAPPGSADSRRPPSQIKDEDIADVNIRPSLQQQRGPSLVARPPSLRVAVAAKAEKGPEPSPSSSSESGRASPASAFTPPPPPPGARTQVTTPAVPKVSGPPSSKADDDDELADADEARDPGEATPGGGAQQDDDALQPKSSAVAETKEYAKFFKMLQMGIPKPAVQQKMRVEGLDPSVLDDDDSDDDDDDDTPRPAPSATTARPDFKPPPPPQTAPRDEEPVPPPMPMPRPNAGLLGAIQQGKTLKKVEPVAARAPNQQPKNDLLSAIRSGAKLKKRAADPEGAPAKAPAPAQAGGLFGDEVSKILSLRQKIAVEDSDTDDDDDDDDWEDDDD